jgi:hypothetical protein
MSLLWYLIITIDGLIWLYFTYYFIYRDDADKPGPTRMWDKSFWLGCQAFMLIPGLNLVIYILSSLAVFILLVTGEYKINKYLLYRKHIVKFKRWLADKEYKQPL